MIVRQGFIRGRIKAGRELEFRRFVEDNLIPMWRTFPGLVDMRVQFEVSRDEGAAPIPLSLAMTFESEAAVLEALAAPVRFESRSVTTELIGMLDDTVEYRVEHHVFEILPTGQPSGGNATKLERVLRSMNRL